MAGASVRGQCDKLGLSDGPLAADQLDALLECIGPGLHVFVGRDRAKHVLVEIRESVAKLDGGA